MFISLLFLALLPFLYNSTSVSYYVTYNSSTFCVNLDECGSKSSPFPSILSAFYFIDSSAEQINANFTNINLYLLYDYYVIDSMNVTFYLNKLNDLYGGTDIFWAVFEKIRNIKINILSNNSGQLATISFRTLNIGFKIDQCEFNLYKLALEFSQINYNLVEPSDCLYWREGCCIMEKILSYGDPCFILPNIPYYVQTYFNFIEIVNPFFTFVVFSYCEINNLNLPKFYSNFFIKSFLQEISEGIFLSFEFTKFQNISLKENFFIGSASSFNNPFFFTYNQKYFRFYESSLAFSFEQSGLTIFAFNNYESVSFESSNITNVLKLIVFNQVRYLYLIKLYISACKTDVYPFLTKDYISGSIYKTFCKESNFTGEFFNNHIFNNSGNLYINGCNFYGLQLDQTPFFLLSYIDVLDIKNMMIIFESVNVKDQNVFSFIKLNSLFVNEMQIFNYGNLSLKFFILDNLQSALLLKKILINQNSEIENQFVGFHFKNILAPILIANSMFRKAFFIVEGFEIIYAIFSIFSSNFDMSYPIFSFNDKNQIYLQYCNFTKASFKKAGTIFSLGYLNYVIISKCIFSFLENFEGGAVISAMSDNYISIQNSNFSDIFSFDKGGAILLTENNKLIINNSKIDNISAINSGGFLYSSQSSNLIWIVSSKISNVFSAEGGMILLNYKSFFFFSQSYIRSASVTYLGGAFNLKTSNLGYILNCTFESLVSEEAAGFISLLESNKLLISALKVEYIQSIGNVGNIYMRSKNILVIRCFEVRNVHNSLFHMILNNSMILKNFKIESADNILFLLEQSNIIFLINGIAFNYFSTQALFYILYSNKAIFVNTEIIEKVNQNIRWVFKLIENNSINFLNISLTFLQIIGLIISDKLSRIFFNNLKVNIGKVKDTFIKALDSKIFFIKFSFANEIQDILRIIDRKVMNSITLYSIRNTSLYLTQSLFIGLKGKKIIFEFGSVITSNLYVENTIFRNDENLKKNSYFLTSKFSALIFKKSSFFFYSIKSNDTKITISKSIFHFSFDNGFNFSNTDKKYYNYFTISIKNSIFLKHDDGVFLFSTGQVNYQNQIKIFKSFFAFNTAEMGSVLKAFNLFSFTFKNNRVYANSGKGDELKLSKGGVFYFSSNFSNFNYSLHEYISNHFISNKADAGGVFFLESGFPFLDYEEIILKNNFTKNFARYYGNEITSFTTEIGLEENVQNIHLSNLISGYSYPNCLVSIKTFDYNRQITISNNDDYFYMLKGIGLGGIEVDLSLNWNIYQGGLCFGGFLKNLNFGNSTTFWNNITFNYLDRISSTVYLSYNFRNCTRGEKLTDDFRCTECLRNFYSFTSNIDSFSNCLICSEQLGFFCFGGSKITIKHGFWRKHSNSTNILACLNRDACLGDERLFNENTEYLEYYSISQCGEGYLNPLCAVCKAGWGLNSSYVCSFCGSYEYILKSTFLAIIQLLFMIYTVKRSFYISKYLYTGSFKIENAISMELLKMFSFHAQLLIIIFSLKGSIINFNWIFEVNPFNSNISDNFSLQCLLQALNIELPYYYSKLFLSLNTPGLILFISALYIEILRRRRTGTNRIVIDKIGFLSTLKAVFFVIITLQTSNIIRDSFNGLIYINIADPEEADDLRLFPDPSISYSSLKFQLIRNLVIIPIITIIGIGFPIFIFLQQYQMKKLGSLENKKNLFLYGSFFYSYKDDKFYWDLAVSLRKLFILTIISFSKNLQFENDEGGLISFCLISIFLVLVLFSLNKVRPYKEEFEILHRVEESSLLVLFLSTVVLLPSLTYQSKVSINNSEDGSFSERFRIMGPSIIIYSINGGFYTLLAYQYIKYMNLKNKLIQYLPKIIKENKLLSKLFTQLGSLVPSLKVSMISTTKKSSKYNFAGEMNSDITCCFSKQKVKSSNDLQEKENIESEEEILERKIASWEEGKKELIKFLKGLAKKKDTLIRKLQQMVLKTMSNFEEEIHSKTQIICLEERMKGILFKNNQIEISIIYSIAEEIVNYKIAIKSFSEIFCLDSCELILNTGKENKTDLQKQKKQIESTAFTLNFKIDEAFIYLPILKLGLCLKNKKTTIDLILPLPFLYYLPFKSSTEYLLSESEINSLPNFTEKEVYFSSFSFIKRIATLHKIQEFKFPNISKMIAFKFLTKNGNSLIIFWFPIFEKKIGKITMAYEKNDKKLVIMIKSMTEIKICE